MSDLPGPDKSRPETSGWICRACSTPAAIGQIVCPDCGRRQADTSWGSWAVYLPQDLEDAGWQILWRVTLGNTIAPNDPFLVLRRGTEEKIEVTSPGALFVTQLDNGTEQRGGGQATFRLLAPLSQQARDSLFEPVGQATQRTDGVGPRARSQFVGSADETPAQLPSEPRQGFPPAFLWALTAAAVIVLAAGVITGSRALLGNSGQGGEVQIAAEPLREQDIVNELERTVRALNLSRDIAARRAVNERNIYEFANLDMEHLVAPTREKVEAQTRQLEADRNAFLLAVHWLEEASRSSPAGYDIAWARVLEQTSGTVDEEVFRELNMLLLETATSGPRREIKILTWWEGWVNNQG